MPPDATAVLDALDPDQRRAATSAAMPLAVVAPAGSGKTRVLTARIVHRIAQGDIEPSHTLCLTFTRKAADELRGRLRTVGITDHIEAGTFHAVAWRCLRDRWSAQGRREPMLLDRLGPFLAEHVVPDAGRAGVRDLVAELSWARARLITPEQYPGAAAEAGRRHRAGPAWVAEAFAAYTAAKAQRNLVDFDDLLGACATAIEGDPEFAAAQRWRFRHLFVDEFQDVNPLQFRLLEAWRGQRWDVFVVGDTHQSIYGWNGADPGLLDQLAQRWAPLEVIRLDRTHRSSPQVVAAAAAVVRAAGLPERAPRSTGAAGPPARVHAHDTDADELDLVARSIRRSRGPDRPWASFAILARTHELVVAASEALAAAGVPVRMQRQSGLLREPAVRALLRNLEWRDEPLLAALGTTIEEAPEDGPIAQVLAVADQQVEADPSISGRDFAQWAFAHLGDEDRAPDAVVVSTIHAAKGLEWPVVHIIACEDGLVPHVSARRRAERDEEARLLYVAITRAELEVHLHWARRRRRRDTVRDRQRSPFLADFEDLVDEQDHAQDVESAGRGRVAALRSQLSDQYRTADDLVEALRRWRDGRARAARTAPDVVFDDAVLRALVYRRPSTVHELCEVAGLGPARSRRYGEELLALIAQHPAANEGAR